MKHALVIFLFIFTTPCTAQWRYTGFGDLNGDNAGVVLALGVHDSSVFAGYAGDGIWRYTAGTWTVVNKGLDLTQGNIITFASLGAYFFAGSGPPSQGIGFLTTNNGSNWTEPIGGPVGTNGTYVFGQFATRIARSTDSGKTWHHFPQPAGNNYAAIGATVFANTSTGVWRSAHSGDTNTWVRDTMPPGLSLSAFAVIDTQIFAGGAGVFRSVDSGQHWTQISLANRTVNALAASRGYLFAGTDTGVFVSSDSGKNWRDVSEGMGSGMLSAPDVTLLAVLDTTLFADVFCGVGSPSTVIFGYVAQRPISEMTNPDSTASVGQQTQLMDSIEVYPNPANGIVTILSGGTSILGVSVLNVLGEDVLDLPMSGESEITLDISKFASGTYFLRIETTNGIVLRKVVIRE
jgi:Secretion system C-terminal sorting domain